MEKYILSIIIPVYNEENRIAKSIIKIEKYFDTKNENYEVVFVDDKSSDATISVIYKLIKDKPNYRIVKNHKNMGKGFSIQNGVMNSCGKYILFTDADLSTPIEQIEKLLPFIKEYNIVIGSRYLESGSIKIKQPLIRRVISRLGNIIIKLFLGLPYKDTQCGFKLFQNNIAKEVFSKLTIFRWGFDMEVLSIAKIKGFTIKEVAVDWIDDRNSKLRAGRDALNTLKELIKIRKNIKENKY